MSKFGPQNKRGGSGRRRRRLQGVQVKRLIVDITAENRERLEAVADARRITVATCVDEMIEADWKRRERQIVPRGTLDK